MRKLRQLISRDWWKARKPLAVGLVGLLATALNMGVLHGNAQTAAQLVIAALTAGGVHLAHRAGTGSLLDG